jgi:HEPN domain-containing protein/phosphoserine phosphatase
MSHKKNQEEANRWFVTGKDDLDTAVILKQNQKHAHACFHAQQAVEKAIKAIWYLCDKDPWGHSIFKLVQDLEEVDTDAFSLLNQYTNDAKKLDRLYIPTRYPNGLPDITPDMAYSEDDSQYSIDVAQKILNEVERIIKPAQNQNEENENAEEAQETNEQSETMNINGEQAKKQIPNDLLKRIEQVENWYNNRSEQEFDRKIALFDLDNTLLVGDCGDALFAQLKINEHDKNKPLTIHKKIIPFTWTEYRETLKTKGKVEAYSKVITCMAGLPLKTLLETSQQVMQSDLEYLELEGIKIPVPYPYSPVQALLVRLRSMGYEIYVISATNQYTVRYVAKEYFDIPESHVFGMLPTLVNDPQYGEIIGDEIDGPVTVVEGKVEVYKKNIGSTPPIISGGDSTTDIKMLNLTSPNGLIIWVGEDENKLASINKDITHPEIVYFLKR